MFDTSRIYPMLDKVQAYLGRWLEGHLEQIYPTDWWDRGVMSVLVPEQCEQVLDDGAKTPSDLDLSMQISVFRGNWTLLRRKFHLNQQLYDDAVTVKRIRNKYSHKKSGADYEERFEHDIKTVKLFLKGLGAPGSLLNEIGNPSNGNQNNRSNLNQEYVAMSYRERINSIVPVSFAAIIDAARQALPENVRRTPWIGLEHGVVPLDSEQKLDQYLAAYGKMHIEKIRECFAQLETPEEDLPPPVSVVDWGCGQALATCSFFDWLREENNVGIGRISRVHLIEPSNMALERARLNVEAYQQQYNAAFEIKNANKYINDVQAEDFDIEGVHTTIHLFSNILDIESVDLDFLSRFITNNFTGRQIFFCVGPLNQGASRIQEFATKCGIPEKDILAKRQGRLAQFGTISMLMFIIEQGVATAKKIVFEPTPVNVQSNIALQRLINKHQPKQDVLDKLIQFYQMTTELEQIKEPEVRNFTAFQLTENNGEFNVSLVGNKDFLERFERNAVAKWPKDLYFGLDVNWNANDYRLLYYIKPIDELKNVDLVTVPVCLKLKDFSINIGCAEALQLSDEQIAIIERRLRSEDVTLGSLGELLEQVIGTGLALCTKQINVSFCDKNIALSQIYSELTRINSEEVRKSPLLQAFLEYAEFDNAVDSIFPEELISVVPMDDSQRQAVCNALNSRVSVVIGPPGCGKTQLILNLLANSVVHGKKVLVASKNNKAVDNVKDRFAAFDPNGCFLRFGTRNYIRDVTCPQIRRLLNLSQQPDYDDRQYETDISRLENLHLMLEKTPELTQELSSRREDKFAADGKVNDFKTEVQRIEAALDNVIGEFHDEAKRILESEIDCLRKEIVAEEVRIGEFSANIDVAKQQRVQILPELCQQVRALCEDRLESLRKEEANTTTNISNLERNITIIRDRTGAELRALSDKYRGCSALEPIVSEVISERARDLRRLRNDIEYRTSGIGSVLRRLFGKAKFARQVLDHIAGFENLLQTYVAELDCRDSVSSFRKCSDVIDFCKIIEHGFDMILRYRNKREIIISNANRETRPVTNQITSKRERLSAICAEIQVFSGYMADEATFQNYVQNTYADRIAKKYDEINVRIGQMEEATGAVKTSIQQKKQDIASKESILIDDDSFNQYTIRVCRFGISNKREKLTQRKRCIEQNLRDEEKKARLAEARINKISEYLRNARNLEAQIQNADFGCEAVCRALDHYLHTNPVRGITPSQAIVAYNTYLPDNLPWRNGDMNRFYEAANRFLDVFRLQSVTSLSVKSAFPRKEELFDLLIIDEASQCDVASALPLILRAKQVVVIGDPMQLRHISRVEPDEELAIKRHLNLSGAVHLKYAEASLWDYARNWLPSCGDTRPCMLGNHYRCHPNIIGYSNAMFYNQLMFGGINICTANRSTQVSPNCGIVWHDVRGRQVNASVNANQVEVQEAVRIAVFYAQQNPALTVGIVTPFTDQAQRIHNLIPANLHERIEANTVHKYQGDEKDVMIYSLVVTDNSPDSKIKWIDYKVPNLVNVAVTRAKQLLVIVGNKNYIKNHSRENLPLGHLVAYVDRINANAQGGARNG